MKYATLPSAAVNTNLAATFADQPVKENKSMCLTILQYPTEQVNSTPLRMLHVIALALDMNPECYRMKTRVREVVELRFIASILLRQYFPALTLQQIGGYFGGQDHTSVINGISRGYNLIYVRDIAFTKKYNAATKSVDAWLTREAA